MKKMLWLALGIFLSGLVAGQVSADETAGQPAPSAAQGTPQVRTEKLAGGVSLIQQDIVNKREEARQRRDRMLKVRAQTIKAEQQQAREQAGAR